MILDALRAFVVVCCVWARSTPTCDDLAAAAAAAAVNHPSDKWRVDKQTGVYDGQRHGCRWNTCRYRWWMEKDRTRVPLLTWMVRSESRGSGRSKTPSTGMINNVAYAVPSLAVPPGVIL